MNEDNIISEKKINKGLEYLGINYSEKEKKLALRPFLKAFLLESEFAEEEEYDFQSLMGVIFLLSGSDFNEKIQSIFRLFDDENDNSLCASELEKMLGCLFQGVINYSDNFFNQLAFTENFSNSFSEIKTDEKNIKTKKKVKFFELFYFIFLC